MFVNKADKNLVRGPFLATDLYENLRQTNGNVTWCGLEDRMNNIVSRETIRSHIISIEDFTYRVSHISPMLNPQVEQSHTLNQSKILLTVLVVYSQYLISK